MNKGQESTHAISDYIEYESNDSNSKSSSSQSEEEEEGSWDIPIRTRQRFPRDQLKTLENLYKTTKRPPLEEKEKLAKKFGTSVKRIQIWFQNRRAKDKKISSSGSSSPKPSQKASSSVTSTTTSTAKTSLVTATISLVPKVSQVEARVEDIPDTMADLTPRSRPLDQRAAARFQRSQAPLPGYHRRPVIPERHPMHFPTTANTQVHDAGGFYHPYFTPDMWYPKYRIGNPHTINQSRNISTTTTAIDQHPQQQHQQRLNKVTRSQTKKRKM